MKKELVSRRQTLQGLADSLDILDPANFSDQGDMTNNLKIKRENRELCWIHLPPVKAVGSDADSFEVVVQPYDNNSQMLRFMGQLDRILNDADSYGDILHRSHTRGCSTAVMIQMQSSKFTNLVLKMAIVPRVEKVAEDTPVIVTTVIFPQKPEKRLLSGIRSGIRPSKRVQVFLN